MTKYCFMTIYYDEIQCVSNSTICGCPGRRRTSDKQRPFRRRLHLLFQRFQPAGEEVVDGGNPVELLRGGEALVHRFQFRAGTVLIVSALDEDLGGGAVLQIIGGRTPARGESGGHQKTGARLLASTAGNPARAEGKAGE